MKAIEELKFKHYTLSKDSDKKYIVSVDNAVEHGSELFTFVIGSMNNGEIIIERDGRIISNFKTYSDSESKYKEYCDILSKFYNCEIFSQNSR